MLSRIARELYWVGRHLVRGEHTARMLDGLFHADLQARPDDPTSVKLSSDALLAIMGAHANDAGGANGGSRSGDAIVTRLTLDRDTPASISSCVIAARTGAATVRDTISAEMWEALNGLHLEIDRWDPAMGARTGPYSICSHVRQSCGLFWGLTSRTMLRDEARAFLVAGGCIESADMVLRMLRVALPPVRAGREDEAPRRDGNALALLHAVGGFQAFMRSAATPPNASPVARFLLFDREFPDAVAASAEALREELVRADPEWRDSPPVLRLSRLTAELRFRAGAPGEWDELVPAFAGYQRELERVDAELEERYFGAPAAAIEATPA